MCKKQKKNLCPELIISGTFEDSECQFLNKQHTHKQFLRESNAQVM